MLNRTIVVTIWTAAVLAFGTVGIAQSNGGAERFTFTANASNTAVSGSDRLEIVINQWSSDEERDRLLAVLKTEGSEKLTESFRMGSSVGYVYWPGNLQYTVRFASRMPRPDGGEDVILATDYPVNVWWDSSVPTPKTFGNGTVIQLHLNKEGKGEGKLSSGTKLSATKDGKGFMVDDYAKQPIVLADVQRQRRNT